MSVTIEDRPIETLREEVIDQLIMNYSHGEISLEAFERRLDIAMTTNLHAELIKLTEDLKLAVDKAYVDSKKEKLEAQIGKKKPMEEIDTILQVISSSSRSGNWTAAEQIKLISVMGSIELDFSEAKFTSKETKVKVCSVMSGDVIYVPDNVNVTSRIFSIFGYVDQNVLSSGDPNQPTIILEGYSVFSSVEVKVKRTMKERFLDFAEVFKNLLG